MKNKEKKLSFRSALEEGMCCKLKYRANLVLIYFSSSQQQQQDLYYVKKKKKKHKRKRRRLSLSRTFNNVIILKV